MYTVRTSVTIRKNIADEQKALCMAGRFGKLLPQNIAPNLTLI